MMIDIICLWTGRIVWLCFILVMLMFTLPGIWHWIQGVYSCKIKHFIPKYWRTYEYMFEEWGAAIAAAPDGDWKKQVTIKRIGRLYIFHSPSACFGCRYSLGITTKRKEGE